MYLLVTTVNRAKTAEPIEMPLGKRDSCGSKEPLDRSAYWRHLANIIEHLAVPGIWRTGVSVCRLLVQSSGSIRPKYFPYNATFRQSHSPLVENSC